MMDHPLDKPAPSHDNPTPEATPGGSPQDDREIKILVNGNPVVLTGRDHTGAEIKAAAIAQGVNIKQDFVLSIERGNGKTDLVGDDEVIKLHPGERFIALDNDDNS